MLNKYNPKHKGTHIIRVTFMQRNYVGHISYKMGGNCRGAALLNPEFLESDNQSDIDLYVENDCSLKWDEETETFSVTLKNPEGDELYIEDESDEISDMIVGIEFTDYTPDK